MEPNLSEMICIINPNPEQICNNNDIKQENHNYQEYSSEFSCSVCGKRFKTEHRLTIHLLFHTSDKTFNCKICHTKFHEMTELLIHIKNHRLEKSLKCRPLLRRGTKRLRRARKCT